MGKVIIETINDPLVKYLAIEFFGCDLMEDEYDSFVEHAAKIREMVKKEDE